MSYYSQVQYKEKNNVWFEDLYFNRWFKGNNGPILDVGCATGNFIATHPDIVEGIDSDDDSIAIGLKRGFRIKKVDIENQLDILPDNYYSGIYAKQIIEHLSNPLYFMTNIHRSLKSGAKAVILTPNCPYALNRFFWDDYTHKRPLTKISLRRLAMDAGFTKIKIYEDFRCFKGLGFLIRRFKIKPHTIIRWQRALGIRGLSLILEVEK